MSKNTLTVSLRKNIYLLIISGVMTLTIFSAINHYYGSFQGGMAWINSSREAVRTLHRKLATHDLDLLSLLTAPTQRSIIDHKTYCSFRINESAILRLDVGLGEASHLCSGQIKEYLNQIDSPSPQSTSYQMFDGSIYLMSLIYNSQGLKALLTPVDQKWVNFLQSMTATEILLRSTTQTSIHTFKCEERCLPELVQKDRTLTKSHPPRLLPPTTHLEIVTKSPYQGTYELFHIGEKNFNAFAAEVPIFNREGEFIGGLWITVPENVMLYWSKVGVLVITLLGFILTLLLMYRVNKLTSYHLTPITELINEVDIIRQSINNHKGSTGDSIPAYVEQANELEQLKLAFNSLKEQILFNDRLSDQLRRTQKLEVIGTLAGGVAHDFNNLLSVILMNCELLKADFTNQLTGEQTTPTLLSVDSGLMAEWSEQADEMLSTCDQATTLTKQLLSLSRDQRAEKSSISIRACCEDMTKLFRRVINEDIIFDVSLPNSEDLFVLGNENALKQALMNIIINARDSIIGAGRISLIITQEKIDHTSSTVTGALSRGSYVRFSLSDTGEGISQETIGRLFEPFFSSKGVKGTGLGLTIVYNTIVREMGGAIDVLSKDKKGTTFHLYLPQSYDKPILPFNQVIVTPTPVRTYYIILIEDNLQVQMTLSKGLERHGFELTSFNSAPEFLQWRERSHQSIDLIISDVVMPVMSGPELWAMMKLTEPDLPFLFLTGYAGEAITKYEVPEHLVLNKPISARELTSAILKRIEG